MHQRNQLCPVQLLTEETIRKFQVENILNNKKIHLSRNRKLGIRQALACMCAETKCLMNNEIVTNWCVLFIFLFYGLVQSVHIWCIQMYHVFFLKKPHALLRLGRQTWINSMKNMGMAYISLNNSYHPYNKEVHLNTRAPKT